MLGGMDVGAWLETLGLGQYARVFAENDIDFALLPNLTDADLRELGIGSLGHRKRILAAAAEMAPSLPAASPPAPALAPATPSAHERRQVTILFADLSGFTELSHTLDAEELHDLVGRYTADVDRTVVEYGGTVDKHIGDAVMALFGAPRAHDDDPLRAARAALDIHEAIGLLGVSLGRDLQAHVGIASGEVVAGAVGRVDAQDYTVLGESVNLAARLVAAAGPGQTLISESVHRALAAQVVSEPLGEMRFKGIEAPVRVWRLRALAAEGPLATRVPFIGRGAELEQFKGILAACLGRRRGQVIYVRGEAGIGKTRLVEEMRRLAEVLGFINHRGLVLDFGVGKGQDPIRTIVRSLLGLSGSADPDERQRAADRVAGEGRVGAERIAFLHDLLDLPQRGEDRALYDAMDNTARNRGKRAVVAGLVEDACSHAPTMIMVEDLHWADPLVLQHTAAIAAAVANGPGLLVATSRIEGDRLDAAWRAGCRATPFATIDLGP
ncbi:MAG TPA: adenylate/guanylate cyclase domain-containing protein, partial [Alphaproteobacteria bacterium]